MIAIRKRGALGHQRPPKRGTVSPFDGGYIYIYKIYEYITGQLLIPTQDNKLVWQPFIRGGACHKYRVTTDGHGVAAKNRTSWQVSCSLAQWYPEHRHLSI